MSLAEFFRYSEKFEDPYRSLVKIVADKWQEESYFNNFVISGPMPQEEQSYMMAFSIIGLAHGYEGFLECHVTEGGELQEAKNLSKIRISALSLQVPNHIKATNMNLLGGIIHSKFGINALHVLGMVTLHQTINTKKDMVVLWSNYKIQRPLIDHIVRSVLEERLVG